MKINLEFKNAPKTGNLPKVEPGDHWLKVLECREVTAQTGTKMFQVDFQIEGTGLKVLWDNFPLQSKDGMDIPFGHRKLIKLAEAANIEINSDTTLKLLAAVLPGKVVKAELEYKGDTEYLQVAGDKFIKVESPFATDEVTEDPDEII